APLVDGIYVLRARAVDRAGNTSDGPPLTLTIRPDAGELVPTLRLAPESDTGLRGDGQTSERRPFLVGEAGPNLTIELVGPDGTVLASGTTDAQGGYRLQLAGELANGTIVLRARTRGPGGF